MPKEKEQNKSNRVIDDSMNRVLAKIQGENPDVKKVTVSPTQSSFLTKIFMPRGANAVTNPFTGNITYNPEMMEGMSPEEKEQVMSHELTHVRQTQKVPWHKLVAEILKPDETPPPGQNFPLNDSYYWRPREMEAFQAERDRATRLKTPNYIDPVLGTRDIPLIPNVGPSPNVRKKILGE